ncbi:universal stress protein (plasmid) [Natrinema thermotolerans]|uniref:Universal stress protein n=1 Tax=Natrinema thermotolerans TaxID=121872 RepID=A0AAF0T3Q7_9EURY|nr:universal stress protein [Natrinema thermotolerans]QCC57125.1 universal stress protein [Natrinema thermotolerans]WMT10278.1 universal stress protein [Natrinema thermotolerans]
MGNTSESRPILVAVANPDHAEQLVRTAGDLARVTDGLVQIVSVIAKPHNSPFSLYTDDTIIEQYSGTSQKILNKATEVAPDDVTVTSELIVGRSTADGVLTAVEQTNARALVVGWQERKRRTDAVLGTTIDRLIEHAPCDLYVERIGQEANSVDSILLPVAGGPHVRPAASVAKAIAARNDAAVHVFSVAATDTDSETAREYIASAKMKLEEAPGPPIQMEPVIHDGDDITEGIVEAAIDHDVIVFGATRQGALHRRLVGSVPRTVVHQTDRTILLARSGDIIERSAKRLLPWV